MKQYDQVKDGIQLIRKNAEAIDNLKSKEQRAVNENERKGKAMVIGSRVVELNLLRDT